jgi:hypothetical protein
MDSCTGRGINEATHEHQENCMFVVNKEKIWIIATRSIEPGEQIYIQYVFHHWMHEKWSCLLQRLMFAKYEPTISQEHKATWRNIIRKKVEQRANDRIYAPRSILTFHPQAHQSAGSKQEHGRHFCSQV